MSFWGKDALEDRQIKSLTDDLQEDCDWNNGLSEVEEVLFLDIQEKRKQFYKPPIGKTSSPIKVIFPTDIETSTVPHWKTAKTILRVDIETGNVLEIDREAIPGLK